MDYDSIYSNGKLSGFLSGVTRVAIYHHLVNSVKGKLMKRMLLRIMLLIPALLMIAACESALTVERRTIGIRSGEFIYTDGYLRSAYPFPLIKSGPPARKL